MVLARAGLSALGMMVLAIAPGASQTVFTAPLPEDFTARTVSPPSPGGGKRLVFNALPPSGTEATAEGLDGFWGAVSPALEDAGPDRLNQAALQVGPTLARLWTPSEVRSSARQILSRHAGAFVAGARVGNVSQAMLLAVALTESGGNPNAVSPKGAEGIMQLMPSTARRFGVADAFDPEQAAPAAAAYLDELLRRFAGDPVLALAAYNAGEGAVDRHGGVPPFAETRAYVPKVMAAWLALTEGCAPENRAPRSDCLTPGIAPPATRLAAPSGPPRLPQISPDPPDPSDL